MRYFFSCRDGGKRQVSSGTILIEGDVMDLMKSR
jgi:hypothetical protein